MKNATATLLLILLFSTGFAQPIKSPDSVRSISLDEVIIKNKLQNKFANKVRPELVFMQIPGNNSPSHKEFENEYFVTSFPKISETPISVNAVEIKLKPFDTSLFRIKLIILQVFNNDTIYHFFPINTALLKKNKMTVIFDEVITLQPTDFLIGYGFEIKDLKENFKYRFYSTSKGEGGTIRFLNEGINIRINSILPFVFPFKIMYR